VASTPILSDKSLVVVLAINGLFLVVLGHRE
jgi:hypothetical protein